jgi:hypothetical protein
MKQSFIQKLFAFKFVWIGKLFKSANKPFLQAVIDVTNTVKVALNSQLVDILTGIIPGTVDNEIVVILRKQIPVLLADELLLQSAGTPATQEDAQALAQKLLDSFGLIKDEKKGKLYTSIAAELYIFLQEHQNGQKVTFGEAAALVEGFYQDWLAAQTAE